jgi:carboxyl-terminal processing protease
MHTIYRTGRLLTVGFLAGIATCPAYNLLAGRFVGAPRVNAALAQNIDLAETYRLLALFGEVFERVRSDYVDPVSDKELVENAIDGMLTGLDPHSAYLDADEFHEMRVEEKGQFIGIGIEIAQEDGLAKVVSAMDDTPALKAGIKAGDIIVGLNGKSVRRFSAQRILDQMRGPPNTKITLTIERVGLKHPLDISIRRAIIHIKVVKSRLEPDNIGYVRVTEFIEPVDAALKQAVKSLRRQAGGRLRALVLDLRDNPGGLLDQAEAVARDFIPRGQIVSTRGRNRDDSEWVAGKGRDVLGGAPMVVLINSGSASASEVVAGALQDHHRAVLVGDRSFGKGSVQTMIPLPGGRAMLLTTARDYTPSGRSVQGSGIVPDVKVAQSRDEGPHFNPEREADLNHVLNGAGGTPESDEPPRADLPTIVRALPSEPPKDFPEFDPAKLETDFQLQQALAIAKAMIAAAHNGGKAN